VLRGRGKSVAGGAPRAFGHAQMRVVIDEMRALRDESVFFTASNVLPAAVDSGR